MQNSTNIVVLSCSSVPPQNTAPVNPTQESAMCQAMNLTISTEVAVPTLMPRPRICSTWKGCPPDESGVSAL